MRTPPTTFSALVLIRAVLQPYTKQLTLEVIMLRNIRTFYRNAARGTPRVPFSKNYVTIVIRNVLRQNYVKVPRRGTG